MTRKRGYLLEKPSQEVTWASIARPVFIDKLLVKAQIKATQHTQSDRFDIHTHTQHTTQGTLHTATHTHTHTHTAYHTQECVLGHMHHTNMHYCTDMANLTLMDHNNTTKKIPPP